MENENNEYRISFFKPTTPRAKVNRNKVLFLIAIWAIAVFGFQILLKVIEKPTPEPEYVAYEQVWGNIEAGAANPSELITYGQSNLQILSKVFIADADKAILQSELNGVIFKLANEDQKAVLSEKIADFESLSSSIEDITDTEYVLLKNELGLLAGEILSLNPNDIRITILPLELKRELFNELIVSEEIPQIMSKYLIHNRSVLTDFRFLGFPFHYFYSAVFLLILFVFLCWLYCVQTDRIDNELGVSE